MIDDGSSLAHSERCFRCLPESCHAIPSCMHTSQPCQPRLAHLTNIYTCSTSLHSCVLSGTKVEGGFVPKRCGAKDKTQVPFRQESAVQPRRLLLYSAQQYSITAVSQRRSDQTEVYRTIKHISLGRTRFRSRVLATQN